MILNYNLLWSIVLFYSNSWTYLNLIHNYIITWIFDSMSFWFKIVFYSDSSIYFTSKILTFYFALIKLLFPPYQAEILWDIDWDTLNLRNIIHRVKATKFQKQYTCWTYQICWVTNSLPHLKIKTDVSLTPMSFTLVSFTQPNFIKFITVENDVKCPVRDDLKKKINGIFH